MNTTQHKTNYKNSPLGLIPEDWEVKRISEFGKVHTGNTPPTADRDNYGDEFMFVSPGDLGEYKYILKTEKKLSIKGFNMSRKFVSGSVLFTCIGSTIGKSGIAKEELTSNQQINAIELNLYNSNEFLYYQLEINAKQIKLLAGEQAVPILNKSQFEAIKLMSPPLPEQTAIANCLSTWDKAIATQTQLIAQKELRKKALMQQLLSGKKRLKGFSGEWKELRLKDLGKVIPGLTYSPDDVKSKGVLVLRSSNIQQKQLDFKDCVFVEKKEGQFNPVINGDILICVRNGSRSLIGKNVVITHELEGVAFGAFMAIFRSEYNDYLIHLFDTDYYYKEVNKNLGATINSINGSDLKLFKFPIPPREEQTAIANVLQCADTELQLLKKKLQQLKDQKKGLMQVLLTGKKRLEY